MEFGFEIFVLLGGLPLAALVAVGAYFAAGALATLFVLWHLARMAIDFFKGGQSLLALWTLAVAPGIAVACLVGGWVPLLFFYVQGSRAHAPQPSAGRASGPGPSTLGRAAPGL